MTYKYNNLYFSVQSTDCHLIVECKDKRYLVFDYDESDEQRAELDSVAESESVSLDTLRYLLESHYYSFDDCLELAERAQTMTAHELNSYYTV